MVAIFCADEQVYMFYYVNLLLVVRPISIFCYQLFILIRDTFLPPCISSALSRPFPGPPVRSNWSIIWSTAYQFQQREKTANGKEATGEKIEWNQVNSDNKYSIYWRI